MPRKVAPSHASYERNRAYYIARETSEVGKKKRVERDQARTLEIKAGKLRPGSKMTVDHIRPLAKGGTDAKNNLRVISAVANRKKFDH